ncbi:MAG: tetratricopeptide repeat protein [Deltaproteobacteria bacterium]|nr:tetratricopeptide repeat protein [Deltaproteobacteria bacterium]
MAKLTKKQRKRSRKEEKSKKLSATVDVAEGRVYDFISSPLFVLSLLTVLAFIFYSNTFGSPFQLDDGRIIKDNLAMRDPMNFFPPTGPRDLGSLSFALNYSFGELSVYGYHIVNTVIHALSAMAAWWLVRLTLNTPALKDLHISPVVRLYLPLIVAVFFVVHPIQTQSVTYIVQRYASMCTLFYVLSIALYVKGHLSEAKNRKIIFIVLAVVSAIFAMKTKEISFTLPFVVLLYEFTFFKLDHARLKSALPSLVPMLATVVIIPLSLVNMDKPIGELMGELKEASVETEAISRSHYLFTQFRVIVTYIRLMFVPVNQNLDYEIVTSRNFFAPEVFLSFVFLSVLFFGSCYLLYRSRKRGTPLLLLASFGMVWFFMTISVESSIIPIRDLMFEHRLYLPSVGFFLTFTAGVFYLYGVLDRNKVKLPAIGLFVVLFVVVLSVPLGAATLARNAVWKTEITIWRDVIEKSPRKARGYYNLGVALAATGEKQEAEGLYKTAVKLSPKYGHAHYNLGNIYVETGRLDAAMEHYTIAKKLLPKYERIYNNIGVIYTQRQNYNEALEYFKKALEIAPDFTDSLNNMGVIYGNMGRIDEAFSVYREVLKIDPTFADTYNNIGTLYDGRKQYDLGLKNFALAVKYNPLHVKAQFNLGVSYLRKGDMDRGAEELIKVLRLEPSHGEAKKLLTLVNRAKKEGKKIKVE